MDEHAKWDQRYEESDKIWSGQPNGALLAEITGMPPGRVLDVGCGEGADAIWLAQQGWTVTALDVSAVALDRARAAMRLRPVSRSTSYSAGCSRQVSNQAPSTW